MPALGAPSARPSERLAPTPRWLGLALVGSLALHGAAFVAFQWRFADDVERAAGAAEAAITGSIAIPVEILVEAPLPPAPAPANAAAAKTEPSRAEEPAAQARDATDTDWSELARRVPPPEPAPVVLPSEQEARLSLAETPDAAEAAPPARPAAPATAREAASSFAPPAPRENAPAPKLGAAASPSRAAAAGSPGRAGAGGVAESGGHAAVSSYQAQVLAHLSRHRVYPPEARDRGITGVARVQFALGRDGSVLSAALTGASGASVLDEAAVALVRRASPFPPFPAELARTRMEFAAPIRFDLR